MDPTVLAVLSIFGGATLTAAAGLVGASIQAGREHQRWIREQRLTAYRGAHQLVERMRYGDRDQEFMQELARKFGELADEAELSGARRRSFIDAGVVSVAGDRLNPQTRFEWSREILAAKIEVHSLLAIVGTPESIARLEDVFAALNSKDRGAYEAALVQLEKSMKHALRITP